MCLDLTGMNFRSASEPVRDMSGRGLGVILLARVASVFVILDTCKNIANAAEISISSAFLPGIKRVARRAIGVPADRSTDLVRRRRCDY